MSGCRRAARWTPARSGTPTGSWATQPRQPRWNDRRGAEFRFNIDARRGARGRPHDAASRRRAGAARCGLRRCGGPGPDDRARSRDRASVPIWRCAAASWRRWCSARGPTFVLGGFGGHATGSAQDRRRAARRLGAGKVPQARTKRRPSSRTTGRSVSSTARMARPTSSSRPTSRICSRRTTRCISTATAPACG